MWTTNNALILWIKDFFFFPSLSLISSDIQNYCFIKSTISSSLKKSFTNKIYFRKKSRWGQLIVLFLNFIKSLSRGYRPKTFLALFCQILTPTPPKNGDIIYRQPLAGLAGQFRFLHREWVWIACLRHHLGCLQAVVFVICNHDKKYVSCRISR